MAYASESEVICALVLSAHDAGATVSRLEGRSASHRYELRRFGEYWVAAVQEAELGVPLNADQTSINVNWLHEGPRMIMQLEANTFPQLRMAGCKVVLGRLILRSLSSPGVRFLQERGADLGRPAARHHGLPAGVQARGEDGLAELRALLNTPDPCGF